LLIQRPAVQLVHSSPDRLLVLVTANLACIRALYRFLSLFIAFYRFLSLFIAFFNAAGLLFKANSQGKNSEKFGRFSPFIRNQTMTEIISRHSHQSQPLPPFFVAITY